MKKTFNIKDVEKTLKFLSHNSNTEYRYINPNTTEIIAGMTEFNNELCGHYNVYVGINERTLNGTKAEDVISVKTIVIDIDAIRKKGEEKNSCTDDELHVMDETISKTKKWFLSFGFKAPVVAMSGNGYQLWFAIPEIKITDENRKSIENKIKQFNRLIMQQCSSSVCHVDNIGDLPRIIKLIGTLSIKGEDTVDRPHRLSYWVDEPIRDEDDNLKKFILNLEVDVSKEIIPEIETDSKLNFEKLLKKDNKLNLLYSGNILDYKSRSEAEMALMLKLCEYQFSKNQIWSLMSNCKIGKWQESHLSYKEGTHQKAMQQIFITKQLQIHEDYKLDVSKYLIWYDNITKQTFKIPQFDYMQMSQDFVDIQPVFFDESKNWWLWNLTRMCWERIDDSQLVLFLYDCFKWRGLTQSSVRSELLTALMIRGRQNIPEKPPVTWIQFNNKIIDVRTKQEIVPSKRYFLTNPIPHNIDLQNDNISIFDKLFCDWVVDEANMCTLYEILAYCMLPDYPIHRLFCFIGAGRNGKSSYMRLITKFIGETNTTSTDLDRIFDSRFESSKLYKKLVACVGETNFSTLKSTSYLKRLTGQDTVSMEFKNKEPFDAKNYAKILIATNALPATDDKTLGFYSRWVIVDFPNMFEQGTDIIDKITEQDFEALANKCVSTLHYLLLNGRFTHERSFKDKERIYEEKSNPTNLYITQNCDKNENGCIPFWQFYEKLDIFLKQHKRRIMSKPEVGSILRREGFDVKLKAFGENRWQAVFGLQWKDEELNNEIMLKTGENVLLSAQTDIFERIKNQQNL